MKKLIMSSVFGVVVLMASSSIADEFIRCGITPLINIAFESGRSIVKTPAVVNTSDFSLSVEASDMADGTGDVINYPISSSGETVIDEAVKPSRFFRLKATLSQ